MRNPGWKSTIHPALRAPSGVASMRTASPRGRFPALLQEFSVAVQATELSSEQLHDKAKTLRQHIIRMTTAAGSGHPSSSLSAVEVVNALFFAGFLRYDADNPNDPDRDRFVLSKGHAVPVLYAAMAEAGYFSADDLMTLRKLGSPLEGHPNMKRMAGIEASTGSLGQGLSIGVGQALGLRMDGKDARVFVMAGDGEMGEGQVWEAIASAEKIPPRQSRVDRRSERISADGRDQRRPRHDTGSPTRSPPSAGTPRRSTATTSRLPLTPSGTQSKLQIGRRPSSRRRRKASEFCRCWKKPATPTTTANHSRPRWPKTRSLW